MNPQHRFLLAAILSLLAAACASGEKASATTKPPNIVVILVDDLGYGDVSCLNPQGKIPTPQIDRLAASGVVFTDAHTNSSVCTPTRYGLLTGRYCWRSRLDSGVLGGDSPHLIPAARPTVASLLKSRGYATDMIGKWHLGWDFTFRGEGREKRIDFTAPVTNGPEINGFDHYFGFCASLDMGPYVFVQDGRITAVPDRETQGHGQEHRAPAYWRKGLTAPDFRHAEVLPSCVGRACATIKRRAAEGRPFFLYLPLPAPHTPILPNADFAGKSGLNPYADFVLQIDHHVGELMQALRDAGVADDTLVLFTSDNGCSPQADLDALRRRGHDPCAGFRGAKADLYEGGHRVPFIVSLPSRFRPAVSTQTVCLTDLAATAAELAGATLPAAAAEDSFSLVPALEGRTGARDSLVMHSIDGSFAVRQGPWKLLLNSGSGGWSRPRGGKQGLQLYRLDEDPAEQKDLAASRPDKVAELRALLDQLVARGRSSPGPEQPNDRQVNLP
ncbi:MAG: Arylsulfatase precursor [Verrucomicrobiota bacterium]|jgi:arylsulfatase A